MFRRVLVAGGSSGAYDEPGVDDGSGGAGGGHVAQGFVATLISVFFPLVMDNPPIIQKVQIQTESKVNQFLTLAETVDKTA